MSTLHPALHSGVIYWVAAREVIAPGGFTSATWGWNSTGDTGTAFSFGGFAGPWATNMSTANAFSVEGTDVEAVPEPASMLLFGTGITGLIARRIRRRRL
jgi:hypothetical protein